MFSINVADRKASQQSRFILKHVNKKKIKTVFKVFQIHLVWENNIITAYTIPHCLLACINLYRAFVQI